jgi:four helix bundle protein
MARGSLKELETQAILATLLTFMAPDRAQELLQLCTQVGKMLLGLTRSLERDPKRH